MSIFAIGSILGNFCISFQNLLRSEKFMPFLEFSADFCLERGRVTRPLSVSPTFASPSPLFQRPDSYRT